MIGTIKSGSGRRPLEKDLYNRHLASGLPVPTPATHPNPTDLIQREPLTPVVCSRSTNPTAYWSAVVVRGGGPRRGRRLRGNNEDDGPLV